MQPAPSDSTHVEFHEVAARAGRRSKKGQKCHAMPCHAALRTLCLGKE